MGAHIRDLELSLFAHDPESVNAKRRAEIERHTANCAECGASLDFYSVAEEDLHDPTVWQPVGSMAAARMSAYAHRCAAEDAEADELLAPYPGETREGGMGDLWAGGASSTPAAWFAG